MEGKNNSNKFKVKGNVCVFGDSIVWGAFDKEHLGWCNRILKFLMRVYGDECIVYNLGIPADTTSGLLKRIDNECKYRNPDTIIISIGINDAIYLNKEKRIQTQENEFSNNINELINRCRNYTDNILFLGLTRVDEDYTNPVSWDDNQSYLNKNIKMYDEIIKNVCLENNVEYLSVYNLLEDEDFNIDGIHPNERGHEEIFDEIKNKYI